MRIIILSHFATSTIYGLYIYDSINIKRRQFYVSLHQNSNKIKKILFSTKTDNVNKIRRLWTKQTALAHQSIRKVCLKNMKNKIIKKNRLSSVFGIRTVNSLQYVSMTPDDNGNNKRKKMKLKLKRAFFSIVLTAVVFVVVFEVEPEIFYPLFLRLVPKLSHFSLEHSSAVTDSKETSARDQRLDETNSIK